MYMERYSVGEEEHREVHLSAAAFDQLLELTCDTPTILQEAQWRGLGVEQSPGWMHIGEAPGKPHVLLFCRPQDSLAEPEAAEATMKPEAAAEVVPGAPKPRKIKSP